MCVFLQAWDPHSLNGRYIYSHSITVPRPVSGIELSMCQIEWSCGKSTVVAHDSAHVKLLIWNVCYFFCLLTGQNFPYNLSIAWQWVAIIPVKTYYDHVRLDLLSLLQITRVLTICPWNLRKVQRWNKKRFGLILDVRKCWTHGWRKTKKAETSTIEAREARKKGVKQRKSYTSVLTLDRCLNRCFSWGHEKKSSIVLTQP